MKKKFVLTLFVSMLLLLSVLSTRLAITVSASTMHDVYPEQSIQEAINSAESGDTIFVHAGTYYEHVVVNKTVSLIGENRSTTIIDGNTTGIVVRSNASDVEIRGFTVQNGGDFPNSGIIIGSCINNTIRDNIIRNNAYGITLIGSNRCSIVSNTILNSSWASIEIKDSSNNDIYENTIAYNSIGVWITSGSSLNNTFFHNNFIDNLNQAQDFAFTTRWDNGTEGNYWSNYTGVDMNGDGIGNTEIPYLGLDNYPLIIPTSPFPVVWNDVIYPVAMLSNSTVSTFYFSQPSKEIGFYVTGPLNSTGFCNVTIPKSLLRGNPWAITIDEEPLIGLIPPDNATHTFVYFTYTHANTRHIAIQGTWVVPEFPSAVTLSLFMIVILIAIVLKRRIIEEE